MSAKRRRLYILSAYWLSAQRRDPSVFVLSSGVSNGEGYRGHIPPDTKFCTQFNMYNIPKYIDI